MRKVHSMSVNIFISVIFLLLCVFLSSCATTKTGSFTLIVIDDETELPVPDILVNYQLKKDRSWFVDVRQITIDSKKLITNSDGEITVPGRRYFMRWNEMLGGRSFYINLDINNKRKIRSRGFHLLTVFFISKKRNREPLYDNIALVNNNYFATATHVFNLEERKEEADFSTKWFWYHIQEPFNEEARTIVVRLARKE